jgi:hypothetical protein
MENLDIGLGVGLAALAFWGFVAAAVVAGVWNGIRKREAQHETVRRLIESGQTIDQELMDKLLLLSDGGSKRVDRDFKVTGLWILPVAVGMAIFGLVLGSSEPDAMAPLLGISALLACIGVGALVAAKVTAGWYTVDGDSEG